MKIKFVLSLFMLSSIPALTGCSMGKPLTNFGFNSSSSSSVIPVNPYAAGNGALVEGKGAMSVPTADAMIVRIENGLEQSVSANSGNFAKSLRQLKTNLPKLTDPTKASGFDQAQLLVYAACSDLTTGRTPLMQSKYNVNPKSAVSANQSALVAAGVQMLDRYVAGLASGGPTSGQVTTALNDLVQKIAGQSGSTSTIAFMSVCIAANTAGSTMMGF